MEAHWETTANAPKHLFAIPDEEKERNIVQLFPIPGMLSLLATRSTSGVVKGLKAFPKEDRPPSSSPLLRSIPWWPSAFTLRL